MALTRNTYAVDRLLAVFNLAMAGVWLVGIGRWGWAPVLAGAHIVAAGLPLLLRRATSLSRPVALLRRVYPLLWLAGFWTEVDLARRQLHDGAFDGLIIALEDALLGVHPHELWMSSMNSLWFSELLHFSYFAYYATIIVPPLWLLVRGRDEDLMDTLLRMMAVYTVCFLLFALMPVDGPRHTGDLFQGPNGEGFFARLVQLVAVEHGESLGAAFPSSHVAGAITMAWVGWHHFPRWAFWLLAVEAVGVFLSTFYTQAHYAIDSVAGLILAVAVQALLVPAIRSWAERDSPHAVPARRDPSAEPASRTAGEESG